MALEAEGLDDRVDVVHLRPVCGFRCCAWGERAVILGDAPVGHQVQGLGSRVGGKGRSRAVPVYLCCE